MALDNPFDAIGEPVEGKRNPFDLLAAGISPEAPENINPFDAIGYEAPPEPEPMKLEGAQPGFFEKIWPLGSVQDPEVKAAAEAEPFRAELTMEEKMKGPEAPWIDPTTVGFAAGGVGAKLALSAGKGIIKALGRGAVSGGVAAAAEYPIGIATEKVGEKYPKAALPFNIALGILSGATIERVIEKGIIKQFGKSTSALMAKYKKALSEGDYTIPNVREVEESLGAELQRVKGKPLEGEPVDITPEIPKVKPEAPIAEIPKKDIFDTIEPEVKPEILIEKPIVRPEPIVRPIPEAKPAEAVKIVPIRPEVEKVVPTAKPYTAGAKIRVGRSPQVNTIVKELPATKEEKALGERFFEVKNDKTGEVSTVTFEDIKSIKTKIAEKLAEERGEVTLREPEAFEGTDNKVWQDMKEAKQSAKEIRKTSPKKIYQTLKTAVVDVSGNVKVNLLKHGPAGRKAVMHRDLIAGAHSKALKDVNEATDTIYGGFTHREHDYFDAYVNAKRSLEIAKNKPDFKFTKGRTVADFEQLLKDIPTDVTAKIEANASKYWSEMNSQIKQLLDEGLLTPESYRRLSARGKFYSPRQVLEYIDPEKTYNVAGKKITVPDSGIAKLTEEGSLKQIETDTSLLLSQVIERTQTRIFRNRANKALYDLAKVDPENEIIKLAKVIRTTKEGKPVYQPAPQGWDKVSAMVEGKPVEMLMPSNMAKEWIKSDPIFNHITAQTIGYVSGTKILKAMATGLNPEFALSNFPRDIAHVWLTTGEYSKHGPAAALQMGKDLTASLKDAITRKGSYIDYIDEGGGMEFLTHQGRFSPKIKGHLGKIQNVMGYLGETSEILVRLALRNRALKNGASAQEATWIARDYLDFSQGGNFIKAVDAGIPYLNAAIQGTRGLARAAARTPAEFSYKIAQIGSVSMGLYYANKFHNPEAWEQVPSHDKINNWIITTPFSFEDKDGNKKWIYFKIAKDQGQRGVTTVFEALAQKAIGEEVDVDQIQKAVVDTIPIMPSQLMPPALEAIWGYAANKDFWKNEDIWRGPEIKPAEEYTKYTPEAFKAIGRATDMSPERLRYSLSQFFTRGNVWTSMVGYGWKQLLDEMPEADKNKVTQELILNKPFIRRMARTTDPYYQYGKEIEKTKIESSTKRYIATREFDEMANKYIDGTVDRKDVMGYIKEQPLGDRKRLVRRFKRHQRLSGLPERRYWLNLLAVAPEARANLFWNRWRELDIDGKNKLEKQAKRVPSFYSGKFNRRFSELKRKTP